MSEDIKEEVVEDTAPTTDEDFANSLLSEDSLEEQPEELEEQTEDDESEVATPSDPDEEESSEDEAEEESEEEADEEAAEESEEDSDAEESEEGEEDSEEEDPATRILFNDSEGNPVTLEEAQRGHLRQADYTQKTQQLSQEKEALSEVAQNIKQHENEVAENLVMALQVIEPQLAELTQTNWDELASSDPYVYAERRAQLDQAQYRYGKIKEATGQMVEQNKQKAQAQFEQRRNAEADALRMALPALMDPKTGRNLQHEIKTYAMNSVGLSESEASGMIDHRLIVVLDKARQFDALQAGQLSVGRKKVKAGPKKRISGGKPQSKAKKSARQKASAQSRLKAEGSVDAMVDLLMGD